MPMCIYGAHLWLNPRSTLFGFWDLNTGLSYPHPNKTGSFFITPCVIFSVLPDSRRGERRTETRTQWDRTGIIYSERRTSYTTRDITVWSKRATTRNTEGNEPREFMYCNFKQFFSEEYLNIQRLRPYGHVKDLDSLAKVAFARARVCNFEVIWLLRNFSLVNDFKTVHALKMEMTNRILYFSNLIHTSCVKISQSAMQG